MPLSRRQDVQRRRLATAFFLCGDTSGGIGRSGRNRDLQWNV